MRLHLYSAGCMILVAGILLAMKFYLPADLAAVAGAFLINLAWLVWAGFLHRVDPTFPTDPAGTRDRIYHATRWQRALMHIIEGVWVGAVASRPIWMAVVVYSVEMSLLAVFLWRVPQRTPEWRDPGLSAKAALVVAGKLALGLFSALVGRMVF